MSAFKSYFTFLIINISSVCLINAQIPFLWECPKNVKAMDDFNATKYLGKWYEHSKYPFIFEIGGSCTYAIYNETSNSRAISVLNSQINFWVNNRSNVTGTATLTDNPNIGKLLVEFDKVPDKPRSTNYWVLGTDYTSYSVVYSCSDYWLFHATVVWILTRDRNASNEVVDKAYEIIHKNKIADCFLFKTYQKNCPPDKN